MIPLRVLQAMSTDELSDPERRMLVRLYFEARRPRAAAEPAPVELRESADGPRIVWLNGIEELMPKASPKTRAQAVRHLVETGLIRIEEPVEVPGRRGRKAAAVSAALELGDSREANSSELASLLMVRREANSELEDGREANSELGDTREANSESEPLARACAATPLPPPQPQPPSPNWETVGKVLARIGVRSSRDWLRQWGIGHAAWAVGELNLKLAKVNDPNPLDPNDADGCGAYVWTVAKNNRPYRSHFDDWSVLDPWLNPTESPPRLSVVAARAKGWPVDPPPAERGEPVEEPTPATQAAAKGRIPCPGGCGLELPLGQKCGPCSVRAVDAWKRRAQ